MYRIRTALVAVATAVVAAQLLAAPPEVKTFMTERGPAVVMGDFKGPLGKDWRSAKGKWQVADGILVGAELKEDKHGAVTRHALDGKDFVIQYSFKLDGARQTTLSINDAKGHCCRVIINAAGFSVQKDSHDKNVTDKSMVLGKNTTPLKPGVWHTLVLELSGPEMLASVDGESFAHGQHESLDIKKANFGLTVAGETVAFKNLQVWEAKPNPEWAATKTKLLKSAK